MSGLLLEVLLALAILVFIVWWTMFSGRPRGEVPRAQGQAQDMTQDMTPGKTHDLEATQKPPSAAKPSPSDDTKD